MREKYVSVWIWMINGIIAVVTIMFSNNFLINPENDWTLKRNQIPDIAQDGLNTDFALHRKGEIQSGRTVSDPAWRVIDKFNMNQLELPPTPETPDPPKPPNPSDTEPPTIEEAREDLEKRIRIEGIIAPVSANAKLLDTDITVMLIPYERLNPNVKGNILLSDQYNYYDDLTEIGLPVRCIAVEPECVHVDYDFTKGKYTQTFRILIELGSLIPNTYDDWEEEHEDDIESTQQGGVGSNRNPGSNSRNPKTPSKNPPINVDKPITPDQKNIKQFNNNFESEISSLVLTTVRNKDGKPEGVRITIEPKDGSLAQKYGMKKNDTIISINSHPINSFSEGKKWVSEHPDESTYTVVYIRNGREMSRTIQNPNK